MGARGPWGGLSRLGEGVSLTHVLGTVPKCGNPWILWIWFLPTVFCRFSVARHPVLPRLEQTSVPPRVHMPRLWAAAPGHPPEQRAEGPQQPEFTVCPPPSTRQALGPLGAVTHALWVFLSELFSRLLGRVEFIAFPT